MGKSSSSLKKIKRSKDSSKRKKTKRNKSKKIRRLKDHSDDSELSGSDSSSYSSSEEDDYRRKKHRSKVSRKRSRRRYSSTESDDDTRPLKKKKRSKKKNDYVVKKKKIGSRKRPERDNSSTSSESCPVSGSRSSSNGSESDRERGKLGKVKAKKRSKDRSGDSESDECWPVEDEVLRENNPRRLRSVIVIPDAYDNDEREEEIVQVQDAYRARRDGETTISYAGPGADEEGRRSVEFGEDIRFETSKAPHPDDLEAILKKRALENLKRFRGASKKVSSAAEGDPLQIKYQNIEESQDHGLMEQELHVSADSRDVESTRKILQGVDDVRESRSAMTDLASLQDQLSNDPATVKVSSGISTSTTRRKLIRPVWGRESVNAASEKFATDCQNAKTESTNDKDLPDCSLAPGTKNRSENRESRNVNRTNNKQPSSCAETEALDETREASKLEHKTQDETKEASESEQKSIDETKDGSQYEQKTMTVMRGGEMVQVSYKVYIPKKTSALGRRQLRR